MRGKYEEWGSVKEGGKQRVMRGKCEEGRV